MPLTVAALTVKDAEPVDVNVTDCVVAVLTATFPNDKLEVLRLRVAADALSWSAKVSLVLPALAVNVTVCDVLHEFTVAEKLALVAPAGTVTDDGTVTAALLLERFTGNPPVAAAAFSVTVQLSVPVLFIEPLAQLSPFSTGTPVPLRLTAVEPPVDELLVSVSAPDAAPAAVGLNCTVNAAV